MMKKIIFSLTLCLSLPLYAVDSGPSRAPAVVDGCRLNLDQMKRNPQLYKGMEDLCKEIKLCADTVSEEEREAWENYKAAACDITTAPVEIPVPTSREEATEINGAREGKKAVVPIPEKKPVKGSTKK